MRDVDTDVGYEDSGGNRASDVNSEILKSVEIHLGLLEHTVHVAGCESLLSSTNTYGESCIAPQAEFRVGC